MAMQLVRIPFTEVLLPKVQSFDCGEEPWEIEVSASIIPMLGVDKKYWGQPPGPNEQRYSAQILDDLIAEAQKHQADRPILLLFVNEQNTRAVKFYERAGFKELHKPYQDKRTGFVNTRMALVLTAPPA